MSTATRFLKTHWFDRYGVFEGRTPAQDDHLVHPREHGLCQWCGVETSGYEDRRSTQMGFRCEDCMVLLWQHIGHGAQKKKIKSQKTGETTDVVVASSFVHPMPPMNGYIVVSEKDAVRAASAKIGTMGGKKGKTISDAESLRSVLVSPDLSIWSEILEMEGSFDFMKILDRLRICEPPFVVFSAKNKACDVGAGLRVTASLRSVHFFDEGVPYVFDLVTLLDWRNRAEMLELLPEWKMSRKDYWKATMSPSGHEEDKFLKSLSHVPELRSFYENVLSRPVLDDTAKILDRILRRKNGGVK